MISLSLPLEKEPKLFVIVFKPNPSKIFSNGRNSPKGTNLILL